MSTPRSYSNVTLASLGGDLSVVVYLPAGIKKNEDPFYYSSRFDHGSMIGSITRKRRHTVKAEDGSIENKVDTHVLYGTDVWRLPHNSHWPESGVGLASEFGVGDDGNLCFFRCGWPQATDVTNGVLGYLEASNGESFLKIGVGELIKGTCPACDSTGDYKFNSPYMMAKEPDWKMTKLMKNSHDQNNAVQLQQTARLDKFGYSLRKDIALVDNVLSVTTTIQNLGEEPFSTVWYSHHFFTCDGVPVGPGYTLDSVFKTGNMDPVYEEPGTWSWSTPLDQYGEIKTTANSIHLDMKNEIGSGTRVKAEFSNDRSTKGGFTVSACDTSVTASLESPDFESGLLQMYAYNLYMERGTFSPEPQLLLSNLQPQQSASWTMKLNIKDNIDPSHPNDSSWWSHLRNDLSRDTSMSLSSPLQVADGGSLGPLGLLSICVLCTLLLVARNTRYRHRRQYDDIS